MEFYFADGTDVCFFKDGKVTRTPCAYIEKYKLNLENINRSKTWKHSGEGAIFRNDIQAEEKLFCSLNGIYPLPNGDFAYSVTCNESSAVYRHKQTENAKEESSTPPIFGVDPQLSPKQTDEEHIINANDRQFLGGMTDGKTLICSAQRGSTIADLTVFDLQTGDDKTLTEGDTLDVDPYISPIDGKIYFSSKGVGRSSDGEFMGYSNATVNVLDLRAMTVDEIASHEKYHYLKPIPTKDGLYALRIPVKRPHGNPLLEILLIPFRILQAIVNFINVFVQAFTGKSMTSGGNNPAKGRDVDSRETFVKGNLIEVQKELERNRRNREKDFGFVPKSWTVVNLTTGQEMVFGACDFDVTEDGTILYTNGKHIFSYADSKVQKLCDVDACTSIFANHCTVDASSDSPVFEL